jgi:hypothetical protein
MTQHKRILTPFSHGRNTQQYRRWAPDRIARTDPLRYIGDMLAWVHRAIAGAIEFLEGLFGIGSGGVNVNAYAKDGAEGVEVGGRVGSVRRRGGSEEEGWVWELLDVAVSPAEGVCVSAFRVR